MISPLKSINSHPLKPLLKYKNRTNRSLREVSPKTHFWIGGVHKWYIWPAITTMAGVFGKYGVPVGAGVLASANGQERLINTFNKAAKQNKRVKMTISTGPTPNLNKVSYKIVN